MSSPQVPLEERFRYLTEDVLLIGAPGGPNVVELDAGEKLRLGEVESRIDDVEHRLDDLIAAVAERRAL